MGKPLTVDIPHNLGRDEARRRVEEGLGRMQQQLASGLGGMLNVQNRWEGNRLHMQAGGLGQTVAARIDVLADSVHLEVDLPEILAALAERIKSRLANETRLLLEKK